MMELRPYQEEAVQAVTGQFFAGDSHEDRYILLHAATGAGKTIIFAELIRRLLRRMPQMRVLIMAHREILIRQARDKLLRVWPEAEGKIGIACASVTSSDGTGYQIVIGSPGTLINRLDNLDAFDLAIVDECHHIPRVEDRDMQYCQILASLETKNPEIRILGVTATPYRLGHGYIYGDECKEGSTNWFDRMTYSIGMEKLIREGHLCKYRMKRNVADSLASDLRSVRMVGEEYNLGDLSEVMKKKAHVQNVINTVNEFCEGRNHICIFCVDVDHAQRVCMELNHAGISSGAVNTYLPKEVRTAAMADFEEGRTRCMCNVAILTEGWDFPAVDCIILARPTKSAALYVQMIGRGLRLAEDKEDCLIMDTVDNYKLHGLPERPKVKPDDEDGEPPLKECPSCHELIHAALMECPVCGYEFTRKDQEPVKDVGPKAKYIDVPSLYDAPAGNVSAQPETPEVHEFYTDKFAIEFRNSKNKGIPMMMCTFKGWIDGPYNGSKTMLWVSLFFADSVGATKWQVAKSRELWSILFGDVSFPEYIDRAKNMTPFLTPPRTLFVQKNGQKFWQVTESKVAYAS